MAPSHRRLQQYALIISVISILYNGAEGAVSIALGAESSSRSLVFFGVQSGIEVASAAMVVWRFIKVAKPGEEKSAVLSARELRIEKIASTTIACLLVLLSISTEVSAIFDLVRHDHPSTSLSSLIISSSALIIMIFIWLPKRWLAKTLDSSSLQAEATCSLSCIQITLVLFVGSLVYKLWKGGWWVDGATSIVLGLLFGWEGYKMIKWVRDPNFDGGCCGSCKPTTGVLATAELGEQYRDLCQCCSEKSECRDSNECKCAGEDAQSQTEKSCCQPTKNDGSKCCSHEMVQGRKPTARSSADQRRSLDSCCRPSAAPEGSDECGDSCCRPSAAPPTVDSCGDSCCSPGEEEPEAPAATAAAGCSCCA